MACGAVGLLEALGAVLADPQQPLRKASPLFAANPVQPFTNRYGDCCGHRLTRALGEFLNKPIGFRVFDVQAHDFGSSLPCARNHSPTRRQRGQSLESPWFLRMLLPSPGKVALSGASSAAEEIGFISQTSGAAVLSLCFGGLRRRT